MNELMAFLSKIFELLINADKKTFIRSIVPVIVVISIAPYFIDYFYGDIKIKQKIENIKALNDIKISEISDLRLKQYYENIMNDLNINNSVNSNIDYTYSPPVSFFDMFSESKLWKFISGASIWLLISLVIPFAKFENKRKRLLAIVIFIIIILLTGWVGVLIPTFNYGVINYLGYPSIQLLLIIIIALYNKYRQKNNL